MLAARRQMRASRVNTSCRRAPQRRGLATQAPAVQLFQRAIAHGDRRAIIAGGRSFTYKNLLQDSNAVASMLSPQDMKEARVAFLTPPDYSYPMAQWGVWRAGGIAVPLSPSHPPAEMHYVVRDSGASAVLCHADMEAAAAPIAKANKVPLHVLPPPAAHASAAPGDRFDVRPDRGAMIIYTSGTTGRPKGVVTTHSNIEAQIDMLVDAWGWTNTDHILQVLPLHHVHGIVAVLLSSLWSGATCEMQLGFNVNDVWNRLMKGDGLSLFMAVPTIYSKLIAHYKSMMYTPEQKLAVREALQRLRLMVSGSAALPQPVFEEWERISGHRLLERYGMTEIGLVISNPLRGERRPGFVGFPLKGVETRIVAGDGAQEHVVKPGEPGELRIRGRSVFREYWGRPDATRETFDADGFFRTGDIAAVEDGMVRILGRASVDIIKTGGYKVSALDVERVLLAHPAIAEVAVVGLKDAEFGQKIAAIVVAKKDAEVPTLESLRDWARTEMAVYKVPRVLKVVHDLPRNNMGKINKKELTLALFGEKL